MVFVGGNNRDYVDKKGSKEKKVSALMTLEIFSDYV